MQWLMVISRFLEKLGDRIEGTEEVLIADPSPETLQAINYLKKRASVYPEVGLATPGGDQQSS